MPCFKGSIPRPRKSFLNVENMVSATAPRRTNFANALSSSIKPFGPNIRLRPASGLSLPKLGANALVLKDQPPIANGPINTVTSVSNKNGAIASNAVSTFSLNCASIRFLSNNFSLSSCKSCWNKSSKSLIMYFPMNIKPKPANSSMMVVLSSRERGT